MGYTAYPRSPLRRKAFPITCVLVTKRPLLLLPPSSLATILELQEIYSNQDTTVRVIAKLTSLEDVYFHREEKGEETRWNFVGGWRGILRLMVENERSLFVSRIARLSLDRFSDVFMNDSGIVGWTFCYRRCRAH